jgi:CDP-diacylglycerol--glycerol-3-phosphate 3-phosphatidyltransferase
VSPGEVPAIERIKAEARKTVRAALDPVVAVLARLGITPDVVTWTGLLVTVAGAALFAAGRFRLGAVVAVVGCVMDSLDGALARRLGGETRWGAFLDSTTDRIADAALFLGIAVAYGRYPFAVLASEDRLADLLLGPPAATAAVLDGTLEAGFHVLLAVLAMVSALLVSYTRARMEGLGVACRAGWFERPERLIVLLGAALFGAASPVMPWALALLVVFSFLTVFQRVAYARARLKGPA